MSKVSLSAFLCGLLLILAASPPLESQDEDDPGERKELLLDLVREIEESSPRRPPRLLDGHDLRRAPAEVRKIVSVLRSARFDLVVEKGDLPATIDLLRKVTGLNFVISPRARASIQEEKPEVNLTLRGLNAENILNLLVLQLRDYRFIVRYSAVILIRKEEYRPVMLRRFYPVTDIVRPHPDFPAPRLGLESLVNS